MDGAQHEPQSQLYLTPPLIYVAGPYTDPDPWEAEQNVRRAEAVGYEVAKLGAWPVIPHSNTRPCFGSAYTPRMAYAATLQMMRRCDGVFMMRDWKRSTGATDERAEALRLRMPVFYELRWLELWLDGWTNERASCHPSWLPMQVPA